MPIYFRSNYSRICQDIAGSQTCSLVSRNGTRALPSSTAYRSDRGSTGPSSPASAGVGGVPLVFRIVTDLSPQENASSSSCFLSCLSPHLNPPPAGINVPSTFSPGLRLLSSFLSPTNHFHILPILFYSNFPPPPLQVWHCCCW